MNFNILGYFIYLSLSFIIIYNIGKICFFNGKTYLLEFAKDHYELCNQINLWLLVGYYLLNMGYCSMTIVGWIELNSYLDLVEIIASKLSKILLIIAIIHYLNLIILSKYLNQINKH